MYEFQSEMQSIEISAMLDPVSISDAQLQKILASLDALKPSGGVRWETVVPVFLSALFAMCVGIALEHYKERRERVKAATKKAKDELEEINVATIAMATNLEILIHYTFQNVIPHFEESHAAYQESLQIPDVNDEIGKFVRSFQGRYPHIMMTVPALTILEYDFLTRLRFVIAKTPELLQNGNWFAHLSHVLRKHFEDRNRQVELASRQALKGMYFNEIQSSLQIQQSVGVAECVTMLQTIEQIQLICKTLEHAGHAYDKRFGKAKKVVPPIALEEAINRLRVLSQPFIAAMAGGPPPPEPTA